MFKSPSSSADKSEHDSSRESEQEEITSTYMTYMVFLLKHFGLNGSGASLHGVGGDKSSSRDVIDLSAAQSAFGSQRTSWSDVAFMN